jgi:hypothetical protein
MRTPKGYRKATSASTVKGLDDASFTDGTNTGVPAGATHAMIQVLTKNVRWRDDCTLSGLITGVVSNSGLCRITSVAHGLVTSDSINVRGVKGATGANGVAVTVTKIDDDTFDLQGTTFGGTYTTGGSWTKGGVPTASEGMQIVAGSTPFVYDGPLHRLQLIQEAADAIILVSYYRL